MRRSGFVLLGLVGSSIAVAALAQSAPSHSTAQVIEAMKESAPPQGDDSDVIALPGVKQKGFSLGLSGVTNKPAATTAQRPAWTPRKNQYVATRTRAANPGTRAPGMTYGRPLDMRVSFDLNSANLTDQGKTEARVFADAMKSPELAGMRFVVAGHTDARGSAGLNLNLSKRRAQSVVDYLVSQGADRSRLIPEGFGSTRPRPDTTTSDPTNRRVEFARVN